MQIANDENNVFLHLASIHKGSNDEIHSLNIFKHENSMSVTLTLRSWVGLDNTDYNFVQVFIITPNINQIYQNKKQ